MVKGFFKFGDNLVSKCILTFNLEVGTFVYREFLTNRTIVHATPQYPSTTSKIDAIIKATSFLTPYLNMPYII